MTRTCQHCGSTELDKEAKGRGVAKVVWTCQSCGESGLYGNMVES